MSVEVMSVVVDEIFVNEMPIDGMYLNDMPGEGTSVVEDEMSVDEMSVVEMTRCCENEQNVFFKKFVVRIHHQSIINHNYNNVMVDVSVEGTNA
jgi:hypothetical protein